MDNNSLFGVNALHPVIDSKELLFEHIFYHSPNAYTITNGKGVIQNVNQTLCDICGYSKEELLGTPLQLFSALHITDQETQNLWEEITSAETTHHKLWFQHKSGKKLHQDIVITKLDAVYYLVAHTDISEETKKIEQFRYLAYHDPLTGLANRSLLEDRLNHAINNAARTGTKLCVVFCDLNEFKQLNDELGHQIGDNALQEISQRLTAFFRFNDTVARYGGDEFVIVMENLTDNDNLDTMVQKLDEHIRKPLLSGITITASIGIACFPIDGTTPQHLLYMADTKMYNNKNRFYGLS